MRRFFPGTLAFLFLVRLAAFSQAVTVVRIGIAMLRSDAKEVSAAAARDSLVKSLSPRKPDKKLGLSIQAFGLESSQERNGLAEAKEKNCQFVIFSHLTDLQTSEKLVPSGNFGGSDYVPVVSAKVQYRLIRVIDGASYVVGSANATNMSSIREAVLQTMEQVAAKVVADLRAQGSVPLVESASENLATKGAPKELETQFIGTDYCKWLPTGLAHADALRGVCEYAMSLPQKMPNFICDQETSRYRGENRVPRDLITAQVRYEDGNESYSEIKLNGKPAPSAITESPGLWSTGEFGSNLRAIFDLSNQPVFEFSGENTLRSRAAWVFTYQIVRQNHPLWRLRTEDQTLAPPYGGELWIEQKTGALLRFRSIAKDIPPTFPTQRAELLTDYENVAFADGTAFQLPAEATIATKRRDEETTRNVLLFSKCHKFRAKAHIVLNTPVGASSGESSPNASTDGDGPGRQPEENEKVYAILREQAVRDDFAQVEIERRQDLNAATVGALWKLSALEKTRQRNVAKLESAAKAPPLANETLTTIRVSVKLVPVSVVLRDAKGRAVGSLRKEDFQLFDNGKLQASTTFSVGKTGMAAVETAPAAESPEDTAEITSQKKPAAVERSVAFVFDDVRATFEDLTSARDAATRHLAALRTEDRAAIFTTSGQIGVDFTADRDKLQHALTNLQPHPITTGSNCPPMSQYMADLIVNQDDLETLNAATQDAVKCAFGGTQERDSALLARAEQIAKATAFEVLSASSAENQSTLGVLREVFRRTAVAPGSRSVVLVSPGFLTLTPETRQAIMELIDNAIRADIIVNALDVRGLFTPTPAPNASHPSDPVVRFRLDREEASVKSDVLANLAYGTGGTFFHSNNDLDEGFRRTADAPEYIYVLGFSPQKLDGKFHKLRVKLIEGKKLTVQAREGYYALTPRSGR